TELGSKKDRHENLGEGLIGENTLRKFVQHKAFHNIPIMLETPDLKTLETARNEVAKLFNYANVD
ncbi:MAG: hypothetical protein KDD53_07640, partial [Bdellovibrionales bacterium]|nr:hypothetical protein [Bdellovibrionales bacterium]